MLKKSQKETIVNEIAEKIKRSKAIVFSDFKGLNVKEMTKLRKDLRSEGAEFKVIRKTLANLALAKAGVKVDVRKMEGQISLVISQEDEIVASKILAEASKKSEHIKILGGILDNKFLEAEEVMALSKLPGKNDMRAILARTLNAPVTGFVNVLAGNIRGLVNVIKAIGDAKA